MYKSIVGGMSGLVLVLAGLLAAASGKPPNIVMIVADDLGYNDVGWHNPAMLTPHLDRLAGRGSGWSSTTSNPSAHQQGA